MYSHMKYTPCACARGKALGFVCRHHKNCQTRRFRNQCGTYVRSNCRKQQKSVSSGHSPWALHIVWLWSTTPIDHTHVLILLSLLRMLLRTCFFYLKHNLWIQSCLWLYIKKFLVIYIVMDLRRERKQSFKVCEQQEAEIEKKLLRGKRGA